MSAYEIVFDNRKELEACEHKTLERKLGLIVGKPYHNEGAGAIVCELQTEVISVNTTSSGCWPKLGEINAQAVKSHDQMIARIDTVIEELNQHKARLQSDKDALESGNIDLDKKAKTLFE